MAFPVLSHYASRVKYRHALWEGIRVMLIALTPIACLSTRSSLSEVILRFPRLTPQVSSDPPPPHMFATCLLRRHGFVVETSTFAGQINY